jgi:hypothetical protein
MDNLKIYGYVEFWVWVWIISTLPNGSYRWNYTWVLSTTYEGDDQYVYFFRELRRKRNTRSARQGYPHRQ